MVYLIKSRQHTLCYSFSIFIIHILFVKVKYFLTFFAKFNLLSCLFFQFLLHLLEVNAMCCNLLFHLHLILLNVDNFLPLLLFWLRKIPSKPPVLYPSVFKSSCAINTYVLILPLLTMGYPAVPQAGLPESFIKMNPGRCKICWFHITPHSANYLQYFLIYSLAIT